MSLVKVPWPMPARAKPALRRRRAIAWQALLILIFGFVLRASTSAGDTASEYEVKAAFLYNFAKFVSWPDSAFGASGDKLYLCILGEDPFGKTLDTIVSNKTVHDKELAVRRIGDGSDLRHCHVLFVSASEQAQLTSILGQLQGAHVLTVGDSDDFVTRGGIISFLTEGNKVHFQINTDAASRSGLQISSQLLKLATNVIPNQPSGQYP